MSRWSMGTHLLQFHRDGIGLEGADPDGKSRFIRQIHEENNKSV
jgi:hypothetical protein